MKKIILAVFLLFFGAGLIACGSDNYQYEAGDAVNTGPARGYWDGDIFVSQYMGFSFQLPTGWEAEDEELVRTAQGSPASGWLSVSPGDPIGDSVLDSGMPFVLMDMGGFFRLPVIGGYTSGGSIAIHITRPVPGESHEIHQMIELGFWDITEEVVYIGRYQWQAYHAQGEGGTMRWSGFVRADGDIYKVIAIAYSDMFSIDDILSHFSEYP